MSTDIMDRIWWREDLDPTTKFVAIALGDNANDEGVCWPSINTLVRKTGLSRRSVQNALSKLEGNNLLRKRLRTDRSTIYLFVIDNLPKIERTRGEKEASLFDLDIDGPRAGGAPPPRRRCTPPVQEVHPPRAGGAPKPSLEPSLEPSLFTGAQAPAVVEVDPIDKAIDEVAIRWNEAAERHPGMRKARLPLDDARKQAIRNRSKRLEDGQTVDGLWSQFFQRIEESTFLQGREPPGRGRSEPFSLSMTWALKSANFNEIMEGKYGHGNGNRDRITHDGHGRRMGPAEQAAAAALARRGAIGQRRTG